MQGVRMPNVINAYKARTNFGELLNEVSYQKKSIVIQRANKDMAALVPMEIFQAIVDVPENEIELYSNQRIAEFEKADAISADLKQKLDSII